MTTSVESLNDARSLLHGPVLIEDTSGIPGQPSQELLELAEMLRMVEQQSMSEEEKERCRKIARKAIQAKNNPEIASFECAEGMVESFFQLAENNQNNPVDEETRVPGAYFLPSDDKMHEGINRNFRYLMGLEDYHHGEDRLAAQPKIELEIGGIALERQVTFVKPGPDLPEVPHGIQYTYIFKPAE